jgi:hypothetical protein
VSAGLAHPRRDRGRHDRWRNDGQQVVDELPPLELADVSAALRYAADTVTDREIPLQPAAG